MRGCRCSPVVRTTSPHASERCERRSNGATTSSQTTNTTCSGDWPCSPAGSTSQPPKQFVRRNSNLGSLVEQSLVRRFNDDRFGMLETVRELALERLDASGESATIRERHVVYFRRLAESANLREDTDGEQRHVLILTDVDNIRAALGWALENGHIELGLELATALESFGGRPRHPRDGGGSRRYSSGPPGTAGSPGARVARLWHHNRVCRRHPRRASALSTESRCLSQTRRRARRRRRAALPRRERGRSERHGHRAPPDRAEHRDPRARRKQD